MKILVLGHTGSGKTTAAKLIAKMIESPPPRNCSDFIIEDYAMESTDSPVKASNLIKKIIANKNDYRQDLFKYGLGRQAKDPAYPISEAVNHTDVVTGARTKENLDAARSLFSTVVWIDRVAAKSGGTDKLTPDHADIVIDNNGTFKELEDNIRMALIRSDM